MRNPRKLGALLSKRFECRQRGEAGHDGTKRAERVAERARIFKIPVEVERVPPKTACSDGCDPQRQRRCDRRYERAPH
jgi:hypothetical protein